MTKKKIETMLPRLVASYGDAKLITLTEDKQIYSIKAKAIDENGLPYSIGFTGLYAYSLECDTLKLDKDDKLFIARKPIQALRSPVKYIYYFAKYVGEWYIINESNPLDFDLETIKELYNSSDTKLELSDEGFELMLDDFFGKSVVDRCIMDFFNNSDRLDYGEVTIKKVKEYIVNRLKSELT